MRKLKEILFRLRTIITVPKYNAKVFCIGYNKTGTTTVGKCFQLLGYRNASFSSRIWKELYKKGRIDKIIKYTAKFDSFDDLPWLKEDMIPILDEKFPNSKFIYLERDEESWKKSFYQWTYKITGKNPDIDEGYAKYTAHRDFILNYFKDRPTSDFIVLNVKEKEGFKKMADFLGKKSIQDAFPHYHKTSM
jgi:hypothetical protein